MFSCSRQVEDEEGRSVANFSYFYVANSVSCSIHVILVILREIMQKLSNFSFKIKENWENCHSEI